MTVRPSLMGKVPQAENLTSLQLNLASLEKIDKLFFGKNCKEIWF